MLPALQLTLKYTKLSFLSQVPVVKMVREPGARRVSDAFTSVVGVDLPTGQAGAQRWHSEFGMFVNEEVDAN